MNEALSLFKISSKQEIHMSRSGEWSIKTFQYSDNVRYIILHIGETKMEAYRGSSVFLSTNLKIILFPDVYASIL